MRVEVIRVRAMKSLVLVTILLAATGAVLSLPGVSAQQYDPDWDSLDSRPLPAWFDESKVGLFIHWGIYSVPSFYGEWFWEWWKSGVREVVELMERNFKPGFTYQEFARDFTAEFYAPDDWASLFRRSGAKYVVLTSKHHEGYALWPSSYHFAWNAEEIGPHRDLLGELAESVRAAGLKFGTYYSLMEWGPEYYREKEAGFVTNNFPRLKSIPALKEMITKYRPELIWGDGEWEAADSYWESPQFLAWLYNESPVRETVIVNDRWGNETQGRHGGYYNYHDRYNPGVIQPHKWENAMNLENSPRSWAHRREANIGDFMGPQELLRTLVETVACGGNILVNVGPTKDGMIPVIVQERLLQMGEWLELNGEAIYGSLPWTTQNDTATAGVWYTQNQVGSQVYALITRGWPGTEVQLGSVSASLPISRIEMLGTPDTPLQWFPSSGGDGISVTLPPLHMNRSQWLWTLAITLDS